MNQAKKEKRELRGNTLVSGGIKIIIVVLVGANKETTS